MPIYKRDLTVLESTILEALTEGEEGGEALTARQIRHLVDLHDVIDDVLMELTHKGLLHREVTRNKDPYYSASAAGQAIMKREE